jgi:tetratricopeptide (TPR) repeat protein
MADDLLRAARLAWDRKEWGSVWKFANQALNDEPDRPEALYLLGCALREIGHIGLAVTAFRRALALKPDHLNLWMHFAATLHDLNQWEEARDAYLMILKQVPQEAMAMANIASGYVQQGRPREALEWAEKALAIHPTSHVGHIARAFANLGLGRWRAGWEDAEYLYGHHLPERIYGGPGNEEPAWDGSPGKTVVVQMDQGLGDHIMFAQCLIEAIRDCKQVIVECERRMEHFWRRNFPEVIVYPTLGEVELEWPQQHAIDAHVHVSWLGRFYRNSDAAFPRRAYITAKPELVAGWREKLAALPRPWVGLAWQGGLQRSSKHLRSFKLAELQPIMRFAGTLIDLSYHDSCKEVAQWNIDHDEHQVIQPHIVTSDYENTVALAAALDEVVTCTTTLAHVCGALGRHAYVLVPQAPQWRYQHPAGDGLWWYPENSVEMVRQAPGEIGWSHAIARLARKMEGIASLRRVA